jgi:hypothetical protein
VIYIACPYYSPDEGIRNLRHRIANEAAAYLLYTIKEPLFSPLTHNVPLSKILNSLYGLESGHNKDLGHDFWVKKIDLPILRKCNKLIIVTIDGWDTSIGVDEEILAAQAVQIPVQYLEPIFEPNTFFIKEWRLYG